MSEYVNSDTPLHELFKWDFGAVALFIFSAFLIQEMDRTGK